MTGRSFRRAPRGAALAALAVAAGIVGIGGSGAPPRPVVSDVAQVRPAAVRVRAVVAAPARLRIPLLDVDAPVVPVGIEADGELRVPDDPQTVGWWRAGGAPGATGAAGVLAGHVDSAVAGPGALFRLAALRPGDVLSVESGSGTSISFVVRSVRRFAKAALPPEVFAPGPVPQLVLITCGGHFDRTTRQYADNVVMVAS